LAAAIGTPGADLHFEETGAGDPLVFLPGFSASITGYTSLRARLSRQWRVISIDLPGSGRSGPQPRNYTRHYFEDDTETITAFVRSRVSGPVHIVGHSDGGEIGLLIAALHPNLARSVTAWGATGAVDESHRGAATFFNNIVDEKSGENAAYREYLIHAYGEENARKMTQSFARFVTAAIDDGGDISLSKADQIRCPVLLLTGEHDVFAPKVMVDAYASRVSLAETIEVAGGGHDIHVTHTPIFEQEVLDWLESH